MKSALENIIKVVQCCWGFLTDETDCATTPSLRFFITLMLADITQIEPVAGGEHHAVCHVC